MTGTPVSLTFAGRVSLHIASQLYVGLPCHVIYGWAWITVPF